MCLCGSVTLWPSCSHYNCRLVSEDVIAAAVDAVTTAVLDCLKRGDDPTADALRLLLRAYAATGRDDIREALEPALARALEVAGDSSSTAAAGWLILFAETAEASDDMRLRDIASHLASKARVNWDARSSGASAESVDAWLRALLILPDGSAQTAIDELEHLIAVAYEPGHGISGTADDEVQVASALLTAFAVTDRLPYAMLAEELLQRVRRSLCDGTAVPFSFACLAAATLSRMAALHQLSDYRNAAVIAPDADYRSDAVRMLEQIAPDAHTHGIASAAYGLAAGELQSAFR